MSMGQMNAVAKFDESRDEIGGGKYPSHLHAGNSNGGGGNMDDVLKRLGLVESSVSEIRTQVTGIAAVLPHLATKSDLTEQVGLLRTDLTEQVGLLRTDLTGQVGLLRTDLTGQVGLLRTDLTGQVGSLRADLTEKIGLLENRIVKWTIGIIIAVSGLAFTIGKYGH